MAREIENIARSFLIIAKSLRTGQFTRMEMDMIKESCNEILKATDKALLKKEEGDKDG